MEAEKEPSLSRLVAAWEVRAGVIPGTAREELTKRFLYTSDDREEDGKHSKEIGYLSIFNRRMAEATMYHMTMTNPSVNNWAELVFIWY